MKEKIIQILDNKVKPILAKHDGDIRFLDIKDNIVEVQLLGACSGCPSARFTLEEVVLEEIRKEIPQIEDLVATTLISEDIMDMARNILGGKTKTA